MDAAADRAARTVLDAIEEAKAPRARPGRRLHRRVGGRGCGMAELTTYRDAVAEGIAREMRADPTVVCLGEDIGAAEGVFKTTVGLFSEFGATRVWDTPDLGAGDRRGRLGCGDDGYAAGRGDHVLRLHRLLLRLPGQ